MNKKYVLSVLLSLLLILSMVSCQSTAEVVPQEAAPVREEVVVPVAQETKVETPVVTPVAAPEEVPAVVAVAEEPAVQEIPVYETYRFYGYAVNAQIFSNRIVAVYPEAILQSEVVDFLNWLEVPAADYSFEGNVITLYIEDAAGNWGFGCDLLDMYLAEAMQLQMSGTITEIEKYGHTLLDITIEDFFAAGFELGDTVDVYFDSGYVCSAIPFFDGYYVANGEMMLRAYPTHKNIAVCINYGKIYEVAGAEVGDTVKIVLNTKGAALDTQILNSLAYTNNREDYASDAQFANFREIKVGEIGAGKLYRSASPVNNENNRAAYADALAQDAKIYAVLNMADTTDELKSFFAEEGFASKYYKKLYMYGRVIALGMPIDFNSDSFGQDLTAGIAKLAKYRGPYLIHCTEGKDRAGFASALIEALMGATEDEIIADYMVSYANYYSVEAGSATYDYVVGNNIKAMISVIKGSAATLAEGAEAYLLKYGMAAADIATLKANLK